MIRSGIGYDVHKLSENHDLIIAGIAIPFKKGSVGHSDGDALTHAIIDAILGAAALGDLGDYFPSGDDRWKGANSLNLLKDVVYEIEKKGFKIINIDSIVIIQQPKLKTFIEDIRNNLTKTVGIPIDCISVKATTVDRLGAIGAGDGWAAQAIVTLSK